MLLLISYYHYLSVPEMRKVFIFIRLTADAEDQRTCLVIIITVRRYKRLVSISKLAKRFRMEV